MKNIDTILIVKEPILEDNRTNATRTQSGVDRGPGIYVGSYDPRMYSAFNFGRSLQSRLNNIGTGYFSEVSDFGKFVSATVGYNNPITGKTAKKTFVIAFEGKGGDGIVLSSSTRWRTISGVDQAASYIRSACSSLQSLTSN